MRLRQVACPVSRVRDGRMSCRVRDVVCRVRDGVARLVRCVGDVVGCTRDAVRRLKRRM